MYYFVWVGDFMGNGVLIVLLLENFRCRCMVLFGLIVCFGFLSMK